MRAATALAIVGVFLLLSTATLSADFLRLSRDAGLKDSASSDADDKVKLKKGAELNLVDADQTDGYYHVVDPASGIDGFIFRTMGRRFPGTAGAGGAGGTSGGAPNPALAGRVAAGKKKKAQPCVASLAVCPVTGCADPEDDPGHALLNTLKHNTNVSGTPVSLTFSQFKKLQTKFNALHLPVGFGTELSAADRQQLANISLPNGPTISEGAFVQLIGFISPDRKIAASTGESVNCRLTDAPSNDIHLPIVAADDDTEFDSVVVETIPQGRPATWSVPAFKQLQTDGKLLMFRGQLLLDNQHRVHEDPEDTSSEPKRFTIWEIHPVTAIFECTRTTNDCSATNATQWKQIQ